MRMLEKAQRMLEKYPLCNYCLGRQFALLGYELDDQERGEAVKLVLTMFGHQLALSGEKAGISLLKTLVTNGSFNMAAEILTKLKRKVKGKKECHLCEGRFKLLHKLVNYSLEKLKDYEYATFLVGVELPTGVEEREDEFKAEFEVKHGESMRNEFSREIGKMLSKITQKPADYKRPNIVILLNPFTEHISLQVNPIYIAGRYKKLTRGIPQSRWFCMMCRGNGCSRCNWTGKLYPESVEEIIADPTLEKTLGEETAFHAAGREDIDARMLGRGRPFVVETKRPKKRFIDLRGLTQAIDKRAMGKVKVSNLRFANKETVRKLKKAETSEKLYRVIVDFDRNISDLELKTLEKTLNNTCVHQQTPLRVLHRRSDRVREKQIYGVKIMRLASNRIEMRIRCEGGLYIKELITGDKDRTNPSVAKISGAKAEPIELDVLNVFIRGHAQT